MRTTAIVFILILTACGQSGPPGQSIVQGAIDKALEGVRLGGSVQVLGVREPASKEGAVVDLQFSSFQYNANSFGAPLSKNYQQPPEPDIHSPSFSQQMFDYGTKQSHVVVYTGQGAAGLTHYADGRWVLAQIDFNGILLSPNLTLP